MSKRANPGGVGSAVHAGLLFAALVVLWVCLSGRTSPTLLLFLGLGSIFTVMGLTSRMNILDGEASPYFRLLPALRYWAWLGGEIGKSAIAVSREALRADIDLTPKEVIITPQAKTDLGCVTFANSITLTPGTVVIEVLPDRRLRVHALLAEMAAEAGFEEMNARARRAMEGGA